MQNGEACTYFVAKKTSASRFLLAFKTLRVLKESMEPHEGRVKYEYVRIRMFRSLKRSLRQYMHKGNFGLGGVASFSTHKCEQLIIQIKQIYQGNSDLIKQFADTKQGPKIDSTHTKEDSSRFKTYNNKYMADIFSYPALREIYLLYVELIFEETDLNKLCRNWNIHCCDGCHSAECVEKWAQFRRMLEQEAYIHTNATTVFQPIERAQEMVLCC